MPSDDQQLALWADEPPEEAGPLLDLIDRLRADVWQRAGELRDTAPASEVRSDLHRQLKAIAEAMLPGPVLEAEDWAEPSQRRGVSGQPKPLVLLPDFSGTNWRRLESAVLSLMPTSPEQIAELEQAVEEASADPENREAAHRVAASLLSRAQWMNLTPWAILTAVAGAMVKVANDVTPNQLMMLTIIVMVVLWAVPPPRSGS